MNTDEEFEGLRAETGSPVPVRVGVGLFGIVINLTFFLWRPEEWPPVAIAAVAMTAVPAWIMAMIAMLRLGTKRGLFVGYKRPVLYWRWFWWLWIWPTPDEPAWRRTFAIVVLTCVIFGSVGGALRHGIYF